jgi:hypothetical protein
VTKDLRDQYHPSRASLPCWAFLSLLPSRVEPEMSCNVVEAITPRPRHDVFNGAGVLYKRLESCILHRESPRRIQSQRKYYKLEVWFGVGLLTEFDAMEGSYYGRGMYWLYPSPSTYLVAGNSREATLYKTRQGCRDVLGSVGDEE